jgi:structural maintenance of chromosome 2
VNKATVAIVFNNEDTDKSPVGYEQCPEVTVTRQVLIGGKSKYLINGKNASSGQVQNLFHSVQLNVNNPHFLIMQGRITKVLNMKPIEILGMVEEAAGTRMYETKRVNALKTIQKKQAKLDELNTILAEEITPTLERLRGEKQNYLKWSKNNADIERMERFVVAFTFQNAQHTLNSTGQGIEELEQKSRLLLAQASEHKAHLDAKDSEIAKLSSQIKGDYDDKHSLAKKKEQKLSKDLVRATTAWTNSKDTLAKAEKDMKAAEDLVEETKLSLQLKNSQLEEESSGVEEKKDASKLAEEKLAQLTLDYQNMSAGISSSQGNDCRTLPEQISQAHSDSKTAEAKVQQAKLKISHLSKELKVINCISSLFRSMTNVMLTSSNAL